MHVQPFCLFRVALSFVEPFDYMHRDHAAGTAGKVQLSVVQA